MSISSDDKKIRVLLTPAMATDHFLSMDLYLKNLVEALEARADERFAFEVIVPKGVTSTLGRQWRRYVEYPRLIAAYHARYPDAILHVLDHSYAHLCRASMPNILTCHGLENFKLPLRWPWHQALWTYRVRSMRFARQIVAISQDVAADVRRFTATPPDRLSVIYYGIDPLFSPEGPAPAAAATLDPLRRAGERLVLHVGVNIARKNVGLILEAVARLRGEGLPVKFVKVGPDPRDAGYGPQIDRLGLGPHIINLGMLRPEELAGLYRACDVMAFPSLYEGFGRPIVEAQACGLPVVVADTAPANEIGGRGIPTHPPHDAAALAAQLRTVLTDPAARAAVVAAGHENTRRFVWAEHAREIMDLYARVHRDAAAAAG